MPRRRPSPEEDQRTRDWAYDNLRAGIARRRFKCVSVTSRFDCFLCLPSARRPWISIDGAVWDPISKYR